MQDINTLIEELTVIYKKNKKIEKQEENTVIEIISLYGHDEQILKTPNNSPIIQFHDDYLLNN